MLARYARWLHTRWPAGEVEKLPEVRAGGTTAVPGVRIVGDLTGVPLLKLAVDSGARAAQAIAAEPEVARRRGGAGVVDVAIVGGGVSGIAAAVEARRLGLTYVVFEGAQPFDTIAHFPKRKPIFTYPRELEPAGTFTVGADVKEALFDELERQRVAAGVTVEAAAVERVERAGGELRVHLAGRPPVRALRVIIAIGKSGQQRRLGCPGETLDKVYQRLFDPHDYAGQQALVVGGGDGAVEAAVALARAGATVTLAHRGPALTRPKPANLAALRAVERQAPAAGAVHVQLGTTVRAIRADAVDLVGPGGERALPNDVVLTLIGRQAPLDFFRRSGIPIAGEWHPRTWIALIAFFAFCVFLYSWKADTALNRYWSAHRLFPFNMGNLGHGSFGETLTEAAHSPGFYYSFAYTVAVLLFGWRRIRRRQTPYVTRQTVTLALIQLIPLFLLPYLVLPWMGHAGIFDHGLMKTIGDHLFPDRSYWRSFGFILAWPLFVWNVFSGKPLAWWLVIAGVQTFVLIPWMVHRWGKGAYCGWICSCGALAETVGDEQRHKMPHGPAWNRLNMAGQAILAVCFLLFVARIVSWSVPDSAPGRALGRAYDQLFYSHSLYDYYHLVDMFLAGIVGVGLYFWLSGRVWCRFFCPLAALMHIYARFSRFRIFADKPKCISCNVCTSVCHQGIDVMRFAQEGEPMADPECVRCSACVQSCPTGVLRFGRLDAAGAPRLDGVPASSLHRALPALSDGKKRLPILH